MVKDIFGKKVSLEVIDSDSKITVKLNKNNQLNVTIDIEFSTTVGELMSQDNIFFFDTLEDIEEKQNITVREEVTQAIKFARENNIDIFELNKKVYLKYPIRWDNIKGTWKDMLANANFDVKVSSKLNRTYHIKETIREKKGE